MDRPELSKDYADSIPLADEGRATRLLMHTVAELWDVIDDLTRLRPAHWGRFRVTIFGSARTQPATPAYEQVTDLAARIAAMGCEVVTGGGPGLMEAANEGAEAAGAGDRDGSIGVRVRLDFEQATNPFVERAYYHRSFFSRLQHFTLLSNAFVVVPGGIGTTLEAMMIWQLLQVRKLYGTPLIMIGGMWPDLVRWAREHMLAAQPNLADPVDLAIPRCVDSVDAAVAIIGEYHERWARDAGSGAPNAVAGTHDAG
jgi:uncharacterized protein (TIGR00730 family)